MGGTRCALERRLSGRLFGRAAHFVGQLSAVWAASFAWPTRAPCFEYQPPPGVHGEDSLVYIVDGQYVGQVSVTIEPPLTDDTFDVVQHSPEVRLDLLTNDPFFPDYAGST